MVAPLAVPRSQEAGEVVAPLAVPRSQEAGEVVAFQNSLKIILLQ